MQPTELKKARVRAGLTQAQLARQLGTTQAYVSLLERGFRRPSMSLARRAVTVLNLPLTDLPLPTNQGNVSGNLGDWATHGLARLGYPGYSYLDPAKVLASPSEVLLRVLTAECPAPRLLEAMPWLLLHYHGFENNLVKAAWEQSVQNRLGFVVSLAKSVAQQNPNYSNRVQELERLEADLEYYRLAREDDLGETPKSERARSWARNQRTQMAVHWNVLTRLSPQHLSYAP